MKVYEAINRVQADLAQVGIRKDRTNTQGSGYKFRGIDDIYNALAPLIAKHGLCILPRVLNRECVERESKSGNALFYITVDVEFDFVSAEDGSKHTVKTFGEAMDSGDKATNKAMSAAYKYAAFQAFCIPTEGDNDADSNTHQVAPAPAAAKSVAKYDFDSLDAQTQSELRDIAMEAIAYIAKGFVQDAVEYIEAQDLGDLKVPLWSLFDSKQRSAMKAATLKKAA